jgi:hypothetical protein
MTKAAAARTGASSASEFPFHVIDPMRQTPAKSRANGNGARIEARAYSKRSFIAHNDLLSGQRDTA